MLLLQAPLAGAAECVETQRTMTALEGFSAHTTVKNRTDDLTFTTNIYRGGSNLKESKTIAPGKDAGVQMSFSGDLPIRVVVTLFKNNAAFNGTCGFTLSFGDKPKWTPDDPLCGNLDRLCATCEVSCSKSWISSKNRWNTYLTVSD